MAKSDKNDKRAGPRRPSDEFGDLLKEIFDDPDVEKAVGKVAGRVFARMGAALTTGVPPATPASLPPDVLAAYHMLGVAPDADAEVVEAAFRALAKKYHPDAGGDPARMTALNQAHDLIVKSRGQ